MLQLALAFTANYQLKQLRWRRANTLGLLPNSCNLYLPSQSNYDINLNILPLLRLNINLRQLALTTTQSHWSNKHNEHTHQTIAHSRKDFNHIQSSHCSRLNYLVFYAYCYCSISESLIALRLYHRDLMSLSLLLTGRLRRILQWKIACLLLARLLPMSTREEKTVRAITTSWRW